jgi:hypothetical protein
MIPTVHWITWSCLAISSVSSSQDRAEATVRVQVLDNGKLETQSPSGDEVDRTPWWRDDPLSQPIPAYAPLLSGIEVRGSVSGPGELVLCDGSGGEAAVRVDSDFVLGAGAFEPLLGRKLTPRLVLELRSGSWRDVEVWVSLPCPSEAALRAEIVAHLEQIFETWLERGRDDEGSRKTTYLCHYFDAVTGARVMTIPGGLSAVYENMLVANAVAPREEWEAALAAHLDDFLDLGIYPDTGLPREWDCEQDLPSDAKPVEIARYLAFLIDAAEIGPESHRERALAAAARMAETVLAKGVLPDGGLAVKYIPREGTPQLDVPDIRALPPLREGERFTDAARNAIGQLEYTLYWGGTWDTIDPDFDDRFGNWAGAAVWMLKQHPADPLFRRFVRRGFEHFDPIWTDALRFGGSIAADQVRCWRVVGDFMRLEPDLAPRIRPLLASAARAHFKGEQFTNGAWNDLTFSGFDPRDLPVGDFKGAPANLLEGLAYLYAPDLCATDELRGMYTAVLRSSASAYKQRYGWLADRDVTGGVNLAYGEVRLLAGMVQMLENLSR